MERQSKHDIFQRLYQLGEFHHLYNELRKDSTKFFEYSRTMPSTFDYIVQAIGQHISHTSTHFQKKNFCGRKTVCDTEVSPKCYTLKTLYSVPWWSQFGSLEDRYIHYDSNILVHKIIYVARLMQIFYHDYMIYGSCNMNSWKPNICGPYSSKLIKTVAVIITLCAYLYINLCINKIQMLCNSTYCWYLVSVKGSYIPCQQSPCCNFLFYDPTVRVS